MRKVIFCDESTFTLVRRVLKMVRHPSSASQYDPKFTVKTTKHSGSVMVWGASSGNLGRAGLYFVPKNVTTKRSIYINILKEHLCTFCRIHQCDHFIHDGSPNHNSKIVTKFLNRRRETIAVSNSNRGIVVIGAGARCDFPIRNKQCTLPLLSAMRR